MTKGVTAYGNGFNTRNGSRADIHTHRFGLHLTYQVRFTFRNARETQYLRLCARLYLCEVLQDDAESEPSLIYCSFLWTLCSSALSHCKSALGGIKTQLS